MRLWFGPFPLVERLLAVAETQVALLARCQPKNGNVEQRRLRALARAGRFERPRFSYQRVPDLAPLRHNLKCVASRLEGSGALAELYAERARELALETCLVERIATPGFYKLARERFGDPDRRSRQAALDAARSWAALEANDSDVLVRSDDAGDAHSLLSRIRQEVGKRRLPFRVEVCAMSAAAATGDGLVLVAAGRRLSRRATERIVAHEILGHALPRHRASREKLRLFGLSSRGGNDEQEGYALHVEAEGGHLDDARKRELGLRHLAAATVHEGADWVDTARELVALGAFVEEAVAIACRVHRAGGLAREAVYLPAFARVSEAARRDPGVLDWLGRGRLSVDAIAVLRTSDEQRLAATSA